MEPSSAPIAEPILPAQITAVITGPISLIIEFDTIPGNNDSAPNSTSEGRDCRVSTRPIINAVRPTSGNDLYPISKLCFINSLKGYGGLKTSLKNLVVK